MRCALAVTLAVSLLACGGAAPAQRGARSAPGQVEREPLVVEVDASRVGAALRLDVTALGRGAAEGEPFEDPARWRITARQGERALPRLVNGSVSVDRQPAGTRQWDTTVRFSLVYQVHDAGDVTVRLVPPGGPTIERTVAATAEEAAR